MEQLELLRRTAGILESQGVPYLLVGSFASGIYGEPRMTQDIDIVVDLMPAQVAPLCGQFPSPEYYVSLPAARDAVARCSQFNVIHPTSGNKIDFMIADRTGWGREQIARRVPKQVFADQVVYVARADDVILGKLRYYREGGSEKHLRDITGILKISREEVDLEYVQRWAVKFDVTDAWGATMERAGI